ncbi:hypothetical protein KKF61_05680 [Patescibacteria group bacterium]|nr:hypothetical protein [Patescibacteria group bacterium]MBU0963760.1 hypothetical protein [Patescibacteria group bacterium]
MTDKNISFDKLQICDPDKSRSTCHIFISRQSPAEELSLGKLFVITEITSRDKINADIINTIQEELKISYYNTEDLNIETAFEKALESINQRIADMVGDYDVNWLDKLNTIAAVVKGDNLYFSHIGNIHTFLIRNEKISDIIQTTSRDEIQSNNINPLKAFSNIINGPLQSEDIILFCTPTLLDFLSQEKIKRLLLEHNITQAIDMMDKLLSENMNNTSFAAIAVKIESEKSILTEPSAAQQIATPTPTTVTAATSPQGSMDSLLQQQADTSRVLTPSLSNHLWHILKNGAIRIVDFARLQIFRQSPRRIKFNQQMRKYQPTHTASYDQTSKMPVTLKTISRGGKKIGSAVTSGSKSIISLVKKKDQIASGIKSAPTSFKQKITNLIFKFNRLSRVSKLILALVVVIAFILSQSIFNMAISRQTEENNIEYDQTVSLISQKILKAEAALSYGNEDGAKTLLNEAEALINELPDKKQDQKQKIEELQNDINKQQEKTKHIISVDPRQIADFNTVDGPVSVKNLTLINNSLYTFDTAKKTIYSANIELGEISAWPQEDMPNVFKHIIPQNNNSLILLDTDNNAYEFGINNEALTALSLNQPSEEMNITDIFIYDSRLYMLDTNNNQIFRAFRVTGGYNSPTEWKNDGTSLTEAVSLAIDGTIFVLEKNGNVLKMSQGNLQQWSLDAIDPELINADKIFTNTSTDNLYILDKQQQRIIEYTKIGQLLNQYTSELFNNINDFVVDYINKKMYVLNGNTILVFDLQL